MPFDDKRDIGMIAKRIKYARTRAKMTQSDVATCLNITPQQISNYERGLTRVPDNVILRMAELYRVSADFILGISGRIPIPDDLQVVLGDAADNLTQGEGQAAIELYEIFNSFLKYIGTAHKEALHNAAECMEAATLCFTHICEAAQSNISQNDTNTEFASKNEMLYNLKVGEELKRLSERYAYFAIDYAVKTAEKMRSDNN